MNVVLAGSLVLALATVFDDCGNINKSPPENDPNIQPDPSGLPVCPTDPPYLCRAGCMDPTGGQPQLSDQCDTGVGPLTVQFEQAIYDMNQKAMLDGTTPCVPGQMLIDITPCSLGIVPKLVEEPPACMPPAPGCAQ